MKLENTNCDKTQKPNSQTKFVTKLLKKKTSNCD